MAAKVPTPPTHTHPNSPPTFILNVGCRPAFMGNGRNLYNYSVLMFMVSCLAQLVQLSNYHTLIYCVLCIMCVCVLHIKLHIYYMCIHTRTPLHIEIKLGNIFLYIVWCHNLLKNFLSFLNAISKMTQTVHSCTKIGCSFGTGYTHSVITWRAGGQREPWPTKSGHRRSKPPTAWPWRWTKSRQGTKDSSLWSGAKDACLLSVPFRSFSGARAAFGPLTFSKQALMSYSIESTALVQRGRSPPARMALCTNSYIMDIAPITMNCRI
jgi:hypothetical protein